MSERALIYTDEDFAHSTILFAEYSGGGEQHATQDYVIRSLQSEGCIDYMTTVKADGGFTTQRIHKAGPTNFNHDDHEADASPRERDAPRDAPGG